MSGSGGVWPSRDDYQSAVLNPARNLKDARLHRMQVDKYQMGAIQLPHPRSGNFGAVYKFLGAGQNYALKVFDKAQPDRQQRYEMIDRHLAAQSASSYLVSFDYDPQGIKVQSRWYPTLLMDWVEGQTLEAYLEQTLRLNGRVDNGRLCLAWVNVIESLAKRQIAHGDLQHGNILVLPDGALKLVDYDGMFVPAMRTAGLTANEIGLAAYQHPKRYRGYFDTRLDHFAALVILLTLACLTKERWQRYPPDENCLLVRESDLVTPEKSALLAELAASADSPLCKLAAILKRAAQGDLNNIPAFGDVIADGTIREVLNPTWRPSDNAGTQVQNYNSVTVQPSWQNSDQTNTVPPPVPVWVNPPNKIDPPKPVKVDPPKPKPPQTPTLLQEIREMVSCTVGLVIILLALGLIGSLIQWIGKATASH